jgi:hypothetical protein
MAVGTIYLDMNAFKLALATHATKYEFNITLRSVINLGTGCITVARMWAVGGECLPVLWVINAQ